MRISGLGRPFLDEQLHAPGVGAFRIPIVSDAAEAIYEAGKDVVEAGGKALKAAGKAVSKIPVVGDVANIVGDAAAAPVKLASSIASGARIDKALMGSFKEHLRIVREAAPYAQTVISFVPGIGTGVSAAISAGLALAEGQELTEVAKAALRGSLPGGPAAAAAFDTAMNIAAGKNVGKAALESARNLLPSEAAKKAFDIGLAVATGENVQNAVTKGLLELAPAQVKKLAEEGAKALSSAPALNDTFKKLASSQAKEGFLLGVGVLGKAGVGEKALRAVRSKLAPEVRKGFDAAVESQEVSIPFGPKVSTWLKKVRLEEYSKERAEAAKSNPVFQAMNLVALQNAAKAATPEKWYAEVEAAHKSGTITLEQAKSLAKLKDLTYPAARPTMATAKVPVKRPEMTTAPKVTVTPASTQPAAVAPAPVPVVPTTSVPKTLAQMLAYAPYPQV